MTDEIDIVTRFFNDCAKGKQAMQDAYRRDFTSTTVWENVGFSITTGAEEALALMAVLERDLGVATFQADILGIAAHGSKVLTERVDHLVDEHGATRFPLRIMGGFDIVGGKIHGWRDYFDPAAIPH